MFRSAVSVSRAPSGNIRAFKEFNRVRCSDRKYKMETGWDEREQTDWSLFCRWFALALFSFYFSCHTLFPLRAPIKSFWFMHRKPPLFRQPPPFFFLSEMSYKNKTSSPAGTLRLFDSFSTVLIRKQSTCGWGNKAHSIIYDTSLWIETSSWCFPSSLRLIFPSRRYLVFVRVEDAYGMTDLIVAGVFLLTGRAALQTDRASSADLHRCSLWESARLAADVRWWPERGSVTQNTTRGWAGGLAPLFQVHEREDLKDRVWLVSLFFNVFTLHLIQPV